MVGSKKIKFFDGFEFDNWMQVIKYLAAIFMVLALVIGIAWFCVKQYITLYDYDDTVTYYVEQGDTLWIIARQYSDPNKHDPRRVIAIIENINDCDSAIFPGEALEIPIFNCYDGY